MNVKKRAVKTRGNNTLTEAGYWGKIRSVLRRGFRFYPPIKLCKENSRRKYTGKNKRLKWEYECAKCGKWFKEKEIQVDHIVPLGSLKCGDDLAGFIERLTCEVDGLQILCKSCHQTKTNKERKQRCI